MRQSILFPCALAMAIGLAPASATPQAPPQSAGTNGPEAELRAAWAAAGKTAIMGPAKIKLLDEGELALPADYAFIPAAEANRIMTALGNRATPARFGLIVGRNEQDNWLVDLDWIKEGYVRDDEAKEWKADALLTGLRDNTERDNKDREARGLPALDVIGWAQAPAYDSANHRLVWSMLLKERGAAAGTPQTVNYNTYALGREGYFSLDLITDSQHIAQDRAAAAQLLASLHFAPGKRYQDFNSSTDKVAAYGLAGLIGVVAVKKLGLLALMGAFLLKAWKLGLIALAGGTAAVRKFFGRKEPKEDAPL